MIKFVQNKFAGIIFIHLMIFSTVFAVENNQFDTFQDGTTQSWGSGIPNPNPPVIVDNGGPEGDGDKYLSISSNGSLTAGGRLVVFNTAQWSGDFKSAGVNVISMYVKNFGSTELSLRIAIRGSGGDFWSANPVLVLAGSDWEVASFIIDSMHLSGSGTSVSSTLSGVNQFRIIHSSSGAFTGEVIEASLGIDDISAAANPLPVELSLFTGYSTNNQVVLKWTTQSELNNFGFEVQRSVYGGDNKWEKIGFVNGKGNSNNAADYIFIDKDYTSSIMFYRLKQIDFNGSFTYSNEIKLGNNIPDKFSLEQNYPNPFNPSTKIEYSIPIQAKLASSVQLKIYDILGNEISTLVSKEQKPGRYEVEFNASSFASGIYFYQLRVSSTPGDGINFVQTRKMILTK